MKKENIMIIMSACNKIIDIFLGPFLVAYFIKVSVDSMVDLSIFKILNYAFLALFGLFVGFFVEKGHPLATFRVGVISRFIYILTILVLGPDIVNHLSLISALYGMSTITFFIPYNMYRTECTKNQNRDFFETKIKTTSSVISLLVPVILGTMITTTDYQMTTIIILIFSCIQIVSSFYLKPLPESDNIYDLLGTLKTFLKDKQMTKLLISDYFNGLTISNGAISTLITILIMNAFQSDMNLGIINSLAALMSLLAIYLYSKYYHGKKDKKIIYISAIIPVLSVIILTIYQAKFTVILETLAFEVFATGLLDFIFGVRLYNCAKTIIDNSQKTEYWVIREVFLNLGRITSYLLMLFIGIMGIDYLNAILVVISLLLLVFAYIISTINKNEES